MDVVIHGDAEVYVGVCGPFVAGGHVDCPWLMLLPRARWSVVSQGSAAIRDHIGICGLCCYRGHVDVLVLYCHQGL